ncbi:hypothetical protein B0H16DRAFT_1763568 [Mycena metata]|uniref:Uncharacterized protein n=1 Tax=Mycena metata TaxID=1033252 RepID=A0AAD7JXQ2_9AGAR|nr:hypothetical protein B0H16DRAFT_1763568 [Mycena metata]
MGNSCGRYTTCAYAALPAASPDHLAQSTGRASTPPGPCLPIRNAASQRKSHASPHLGIPAAEGEKKKHSLRKHINRARHMRRHPAPASPQRLMSARTIWCMRSALHATLHVHAAADDLQQLARIEPLLHKVVGAPRACGAVQVDRGGVGGVPVLRRAVGGVGRDGGEGHECGGVELFALFGEVEGVGRGGGEEGGEGGGVGGAGGGEGCAGGGGEAGVGACDEGGGVRGGGRGGGGAEGEEGGEGLECGDGGEGGEGEGVVGAGIALAGVARRWHGACVDYVVVESLDVEG